MASSVENIENAVKQACTDKTSLSTFFKNAPEANYRFYTPEDPSNFCTGQLLSSDELKKHKDNFCSLKPEHSVCQTTLIPSVGKASSSFQNDSVMLLCSGITGLSCIMIIVIMVMMKKGSN